MSLIWVLPLIVMALVVVAAWAVSWCCQPDNAAKADLWLSPARRRARDEQELRDIDAWLEKVRKR